MSRGSFSVLGASSDEASDGGAGTLSNPGVRWVAVNMSAATPLLGQSKLCVMGGRGVPLLGDMIQPKLFHHSPPCSCEWNSDRILLGFHH